MRILLGLLRIGSILGMLLVIGCGAKSFQDCSLIAVNVLPQNATADHSAAPPGNSVSFAAFGAAPSGCAMSQTNLVNVTWSLSDTANANISNNPQSFGLATCTGATPAPIVVTATLDASRNNGRTVTGSTSLTCK